MSRRSAAAAVSGSEADVDPARGRYVWDATTEIAATEARAEVVEVEPADVELAIPPEPAHLVDRRRTSLASGLQFSLIAFFVFQLLSIGLVLWDLGLATRSQRPAVVGYAVCAAVGVLSLVVPGRWRAIPIALVTIVGAVLPVYLDRSLLLSMDAKDVWLGRSMTLFVLFPLLVGSAATVSILRRPRRHR